MDEAEADEQPSRPDPHAPARWGSPPPHPASPGCKAVCQQLLHCRPAWLRATARIAGDSQQSGDVCGATLASGEGCERGGGCSLR